MNTPETKPIPTDEPGRPTAAGEEGKQAIPSASTQTHLAWLRTRMALQTTLAAWVRTATSLIGFGFAIVQFLEHFDRAGSRGASKGPHLARVSGLVLIGAGGLTTAIATWKYCSAVKYLGGGDFRGVAGLPTVRREPADVAVWMAVLVCLIGVLAFGLIMTTTELR